MFNVQIRPYQPERTASYSHSEVKQVRVEAVLHWGTTREGSMLYLLYGHTLFVYYSCGCAHLRVYMPCAQLLVVRVTQLQISYLNF